MVLEATSVAPEEPVGAVAEPHTFVNHVEELEAARRNGCPKIDSEERLMSLAELHHLNLLNVKNVNPFQAELENLGGELEYLLDVSLGWLTDQGHERVKINIELSADELGALIGVLEAKEVALDDSLNPVQKCDLI